MSTFGASIWTSKWERLGKTISNYWTEHDRSICLWSLRHFGGGWRKADCFKCCPERLREKLAVVFSSGDLLPNAPMQLDKEQLKGSKRLLFDAIARSALEQTILCMTIYMITFHPAI